MVTNIVAAVTCPQKISNCPLKNEILTVAVRQASFVFKVSERRNSFQAPIKTIIAAVKIPGAASGKTILKKVLSLDEPSMVADSSISFGIWAKCVIRIKVATGKVMLE